MHAMLVVPGRQEQGSLHASAAMPPGSNMHAACADTVATRAESMSAWLGRPCACLRWMLLISGEGPALGAGGLDPGGAGSEGGSGGRFMCSPSRLHCSASTCEAAQHIWRPLGRHWCCRLGNTHSQHGGCSFPSTLQMLAEQGLTAASQALCQISSIAPW